MGLQKIYGMKCVLSLNHISFEQMNLIQRSFQPKFEMRNNNFPRTGSAKPSTLAMVQNLESWAVLAARFLIHPTIKNVLILFYFHAEPNIKLQCIICKFFMWCLAYTLLTLIQFSFFFFIWSNNFLLLQLIQKRPYIFSHS